MSGFSRRRHRIGEQEEQIVLVDVVTERNSGMIDPNDSFLRFQLPLVALCYTEGAGGSVIAHELENLGYKTKRGSTRWAETTVIGIIKNEKYKGDILMGKTFTLDPISKRRLDNFGEEDQFYIRDHHEPIISEEMFDKAQEILKRRAKPRRLGTRLHYRPSV